MRTLTKGLLILATIFLVTAQAVAQCPTGAETFASVGGMMSGVARLRIDTSMADGGSIARFWQSNDQAAGNNFGGQCPPGAFILDESANANCLSGDCVGINGGISAVGCLASTCPDSALTLLIEDYDTGGAPGFGGTAYYVALQTPKDAPGQTDGRRWDFALPTPGGPQENALIPMNEFPRAFITSAARFAGFVDMEQLLADAGEGTYAVDLNVTPLPDGDVVAAYDICLFTGNDDPGRDRSLWSCEDSIPYLEGQDVVNTFQVNCIDAAVFGDDIFVAIGLSFEGGTGTVESSLVGRATEVECDPNIAEPKEPIRRPELGGAKRPKRVIHGGR